MKIRKTRIVEIDTTAVSVGQTIPFSNDNELNLMEVNSIETYINTLLLTSPNGVPVVTQAAGAEVTVTFVCENDQRFYNIPYNSLNTQLNSGILRELQGLKINLQQSYITINSITTIGANQALVFGFMYE